MADFKYEITERIAVLSESGKWTKELNKVSWNGRAENMIFETGIMKIIKLEKVQP